MRDKQYAGITRGDLVHGPEPLAGGIEPEQADVGTLADGGVHGRLGVDSLGAARIRLERKAKQCHARLA